MRCFINSFPTTSPSKVTTWWGVTSCSEWWRWLTWLHNTLCTKACKKPIGTQQGSLLVCRDLCSPFLRCPHCCHCLFVGTVGCHRDCIRSRYSCVILADLQAETQGYARPYGWQNECFNMQLTTAGSPFVFQSPDKGAPPTPPLTLLSLQKALTASSSSQIPATVQWRGPISDNAIAACLSGCAYVRMYLH